MLEVKAQPKISCHPALYAQEYNKKGSEEIMAEN